MTHLLGTRKKFGGHHYNAMAVSKKKATMDKEARLCRKLGVKARVVLSKDPKSGKEYYLYLRR